jgi:hypothetical protein
VSPKLIFIVGSSPFIAPDLSSPTNWYDENPDAVTVILNCLGWFGGWKVVNVGFTKVNPINVENAVV